MTHSEAIWTNAQSTRASLEAAIDEVVSRVTVELQGQTPTFGLLFVSGAFASEFSRLMPLLQEKLPLPALLGCGCAGVLGSDLAGQTREIEDGPAISLTIACLPDVRAAVFHVDCDALPDLDGSPDRWINFIGLDPREQPQIVLLVDPFASDIVDLLQGLDYAYPGTPKIGGLASAGGFGDRSMSLFYSETVDGEVVYRQGRECAVGLALMGKIEIDAIVAQGCRPIGQPFRVADGQRNIILQLEACNEAGSKTADPQPPLEALQDLLADLSDDDRELAKHELFVGVVRDEFKLSLQSGDFLIRNLMGVDPRSGAVAIADRVRPGQRIQFHLRDARASAEDLDSLLRRYEHDRLHQIPIPAPPIGALMFSCLGRGMGLYQKPDFDSSLLRQYHPQADLAGCFCNGEIGPVSGNTFLHGYTSVIGLVRLLN